MRNIGVGTFTTTPRMRELVNEALDNNRLSYGPFSKTFEQQFAAIHSAKHGVISNSGTSALHVAVQALKEAHNWQDGSIVLVPSVTFVATINVILHNKLKPVLVDVDPITYNMDTALLREAIHFYAPHVVAVIPVHLFGMMADMNRIAMIVQAMNLTHETRIKIIEDSCECMFATADGGSPGTFGDVACFSTYVAHLISTGVGGISITNNPSYAAKMRSLVNHGRDGIYLSIDDDDGSPENMGEIISRRFSFESIGHSFRVTELEAALGLAQLETWRAMIDKRRHNANYLTGKLSDLSKQLQLPSVPEGFEHSFMMYPIVIRNDGFAGKSVDKTSLTEWLEERGVETRDMLPLVNQPAYSKLGLWKPRDYPVAQWIDKNGFYIGCHQDLSDADLDYVSEVIHGYFSR